MKKVIIYAYTQFNLGDDLFIKILCERYPDTQFLLYAPRGYQKLFHMLPNLRVFPSDTLWFRGVRLLSRKLHLEHVLCNIIAKNYDMAVYIGGSLFIQGENWKKEFRNNKALKLTNKPFFLLGANFGPYDDDEFYIAYKKLFHTYTDICFRDRHSLELFRDLPQTRMAADIVFQLQMPTANTQEKMVVLTVIKPSIRKHLVNSDQLYYQKMSEVAIHFIERGYQVTLMAFCVIEQDDEALTAIKQRIPKHLIPNVATYVYQYHIDEALQILVQSSFIVASRFHAMILGWVMEKPVFPIVYSRKMTNVMQDLHFTGKYCDFDALHTLKANDVFASLNNSTINVSNPVKEAEEHFLLLDKYMK